MERVQKRNRFCDLIESHAEVYIQMLFALRAHLWESVNIRQSFDQFFRQNGIVITCHLHTYSDMMEWFTTEIPGIHSLFPPDPGTTRTKTLTSNRGWSKCAAGSRWEKPLGWLYLCFKNSNLKMTSLFPGSFFQLGHVCFFRNIFDIRYTAWLFLVSSKARLKRRINEVRRGQTWFDVPYFSICTKLRCIHWFCEPFRSNIHWPFMIPGKCFTSRFFVPKMYIQFIKKKLYLKVYLWQATFCARTFHVLVIIFQVFSICVIAKLLFIFNPHKSAVWRNQNSTHFQVKGCIGFKWTSQLWQNSLKTFIKHS